MEMNTTYSFWDLMNNYRVEIPIIQRDYAQGRSDIKSSEIREALLQTIYHALTRNEELDFDFVYGKIQNDDGEKVLLPLDGQQRLTTLFLLHWYFAVVNDELHPEVSRILEKFSYSTRVSSREFCRALVYSDIELQADVSISRQIKDRNWYFSSWDNDPTIKAMLTMLDAIHEKYYGLAENYFDYLRAKDCKISFSFVELENFSLTDDLYIKMNARGKMLSDFENFKAKFIQHFKTLGIKYQRFEESIDDRWVDLLWEYRAENNTIDDSFMNLLKFLTEMIHAEYTNPVDGASPFDKTRILSLIEFYDSQEKVDLLFDLLDLWKDKKDIETSLNTYVSKEYEAGKVRIFENVLLSDLCIKRGTISLSSGTVLYLFMRRKLYFEKIGKEDKYFSDYIRVIRNFISRMRQRKPMFFSVDYRYGRNAVPFIQYVVNELLPVENIYEYLASAKKPTAIAFENFKEEQNIAQAILADEQMKEIIHHVEDLETFQGNISNILDWIQKTKQDIAPIIEAIFEKTDYRLVAQALLTKKDYGYNIGGSHFGNRYYYGAKNDWYTILTTKGYGYDELLSDFLDDYNQRSEDTTEKKLQAMVDAYVARGEFRDWVYYALKYKSIFDNPKLIFSFSNANLDCYKVHRLNGATLNAYHIMMLYVEIANQLEDKICKVEDCYALNAEEGALCLPQNVRIKLDVLPGQFVVEYSKKGKRAEHIHTALEEYRKHNLETLDYVERGVLLCNTVYQYLNSGGK